MNQVIWEESVPVWTEMADRGAPHRIAAGEWRRFVAWRLGGEDAALVEGYEHYVPVTRIAVPLEAAAASPFMDA